MESERIFPDFSEANRRAIARNAASLGYDFGLKQGTIWLKDGFVVGMDDLITFFKRIDPDVHYIVVMHGLEQVRSYMNISGDWKAAS